jgi:Leucine-rich repeat (LRR) protein
MRPAFLVVLLIISSVHGDQITKLCDFEDQLIPDPPSTNNNNETTHEKLTRNPHNNKAVCDCEMKNESPWGLPVIVITCQERGIENTNFQAEILPHSTITLDMGWNKLDFVPDFVGDKLRFMDLSHNSIANLDDNNFSKVNGLTELDLSFNKIDSISVNAFAGLSGLRKLDLSRNYLIHLHTHTFSPLSGLEYLLLSENALNNVIKLGDDGVFVKFGITPKLKKLEMEFCNLTVIDISDGVNLVEAYFGYNSFVSIPEIPRGVEVLDLSENPIEVLTAKFIPHLYHLRVLLMEDMPKLKAVDEYALYGFPRLTELNFQGSKALSFFHPYAFGKEVVNNETDVVLEKLILRGTNLKGLNETLMLVFNNLRELDLGGNPFVCNCETAWLKHITLETNARCDKPKNLKGQLLSEIGETNLNCLHYSTWTSKILNGLLIFGLLLLSAGVVWLIVMGLNPSRRANLQRVGASSPYARITIEPNRAEERF